MRKLKHPDVAELDLTTVLHALADPMRLHIVKVLAAGDPLSCADSCATFQIPRATLSRHYDTLRRAGLVQTRKEGVMYRNTLRRAELEQRFPGLLDAVLRQVMPA